MKKIIFLLALIVACFLSLAHCTDPRRRVIDRVLAKRAAVEPIWSTKKIPYAFSNIIDFDFEDRNTIKNVLVQIQESLSVNGDLCIEFVERKNEKDYMLFADKGDCSSGIGFFTGINTVSLSKGCLQTGVIIHEVLHRYIIYLLKRVR